ncbi:histidinol-phosphatase [Streptomyces sp. PU-14G]|uniref:histidinol-phosphatase n=1 Tax=Streptomyces sp. PU-14G TaxID=2800808 RepID=UPI0034DE709E
MPQPPDLELALQLGDIADRIACGRYRSRDLRVRSKPDRTPVTDADTAVETALRRTLARCRPEDSFAGEETGGSVGSGRSWLIDPIDGTKNFLRGVPAWATLIALLQDGRPVLGVVSAPALHSRWWAAAGHGAWLRRGPDDTAPERLRVSAVDELADAYVSTTRAHTWRTFHSREAYLRLVDACWEDRGFGDFLQHCMVAEGTIDIAAEPVVGAWDIAALKVLVEEAGGVCSDLRGADPQHGIGALSANSRLHASALRILRPPDEPGPPPQPTLEPQRSSAP